MDGLVDCFAKSLPTDLLIINYYLLNVMMNLKSQKLALVFISDFKVCYVNSPTYQVNFLYTVATNPPRSNADCAGSVCQDILVPCQPLCISLVEPGTTKHPLQGLGRHPSHVGASRKRPSEPK